MSYLNPTETPPGYIQSDFLKERYGKQYKVRLPDIAFEQTVDRHHCFYCGNEDHESNLIKCLDKQYRHECCIEFKEEIYKQFKVKSHEPYY